SATSSSISTVEKRSSGRDTSISRGSPIFSTGLIAMFHQFFQYVADPVTRLACDIRDVSHADAIHAGSAARGMVDHDGKRAVAELELARERRFGHSRHSDHVGAVAFHAVDLGGRFQP